MSGTMPPVTDRRSVAVRVGIDGRSIPDADIRGPLGTLDHARALGLDGVFFRTVLDISPTLDAGLLAEVRAHADELGLYMEAGIGKVNPYMLAETPQLRRIGDGDVVRGFRLAMAASAGIGCRELWVGTANFQGDFVGRLAYDRFRTDVSWSDQLIAIEKLLLILAPIARNLGVHLNLETHEEITSFEILRLIEAVGADVLGVVFDSANGLRRLEHPIYAARRVAPFVRQTHVKDVALTRCGGGASYQARPCGAGVVDFDELLPILLDANPTLNLSIENEKVRARGARATTMWIELDDPAFRAAHPDLGAEEWSAYCALLDAYDASVRSGERADSGVYGAASFGYDECIRAIGESAAHLRAIAGRHGTAASVR